jgi:hypothetical protein
MKRIMAKNIFNVIGGIAIVGLILCLIPNGTIFGQNEQHALCAHNKIAYIETQTVQSTKYSSASFGDVVLFDLDTHKKYYVTKDNYVDEAPAISPDGKTIAFLSARKGDPRVLYIQGQGGPRQVYLYDIENKQIKLFWNCDLFLKALVWSTDGKTLYCSDNNHIYAVDKEAGHSKVCGTISGISFIESISISPNNDQLSFGYCIFQPFAYGFGLVHLNNSQVELKHQVQHCLSTGGWSKDGNSLLFCDSLLKVYDIRNNTITPVSIPGEMKDFLVETANYKSESSLFFFAGKYKVYNNGDRRVENYEIYSYDVTTKKIDTITNDGLHKTSFSVYME